MKTNLFFLSCVASLCVIYIFDMQGNMLKTIPVNDRCNVSVTIEGGDLNAGMYIYSLIADGKEIASKRMILTKL